MKLNFGGFVPLSTVDWPGRSSVVIFFNGCPFRCPYCHNYENIMQESYVECLYVEKRMLESKPFASAAVFLGGEPTMQPEPLNYLAKSAKSAGFFVGVHTNGYRPDVIRNLNQKNLVDKYFVDIKAPLISNNYEKIIGADIKNKDIKNKELTGGSRKNIVEAVLKSIREIDQSKAALELKTTVFPNFIGSLSDIENICRSIEKEIKNPNKTEYVIQQGRTENVLSGYIKNNGVYTLEEMEVLGNSAKRILSDINVYIRTEERGRQKIGMP